MVSDKYIWCRNCNEIHHVTPFDRAPVYARTAGERIEVPLDDWRVFMNQHEGHKLEALRRTGEDALSDRFADPMSDQYIPVTNGQDHFVLRSFRKHIDQSLRFELSRGQLEMSAMVIEGQAKEIRKELQNHFPWRAEKPSDEKIDLFVALFTEVVSRLKVEDVRFSHVDASDSSIAYGTLEAGAFEDLLARCSSHFTTAELSALKGFVEDQQDVDGVLAVRVKYRYWLRQS